MKSWKKIPVGEEISVPEKLHEISGRRSLDEPFLPPSYSLPQEASAAAAGFMQKVSTKTKWPAAAAAVAAERKESPRERK